MIANTSVAGAACFILMTLAFVLLRLRNNIFVSALNMVCALLVSVYAWLTFPQRGSGDWIVMSAGLLLYWVGLFFVRVMLLRSVSLNLLVHLSRGQTANTIGEDIAGRLHDMQTYEMVLQTGEHYSLKPFGQFWGFWVMLLYRILRLER